MRADFEKTFPDGPRIECSLEIPDGLPQVTVLFGPSGSGKTTILRCLAGLERPDRGIIRFGGETWFDAERRIDLPPQQRRAGMLFQEYALFPHLTVEGNVGYGLTALAAAKRSERTSEVLRLARLQGFKHRRPRQLSGGERQRTALARALAPRPRLLLLDEPLSALDTPTREELRGELRRFLAGLEIPTLIVTHDRIEALALGDRIAVLAHGRVAQVGPVHEVFSRPHDAEVARIVGVEAVIPGRVVERQADGLVEVEVGRARLIAIDPGGLPDAVLVCIRADDVVLERGAVGQISARNRLAGRITALAPEGPLVRATLDCGFTLAALVTRASHQELALATGDTVTAIIKSPAVHLIPRPGS